MDLSTNAERFAGYADIYDMYRPTPPNVIPDLLCVLAGVERPALVVDLGSGTGISSRIWAARAAEVVGVDPSADMRAQAHARAVELGYGNLRYLEGYSSDTGLADSCADIVTCSQSLHWMEPASTFTEAHRILRAGGVFAAYDCDWPPVINPDIDLAYNQFHQHANVLEKQHGIVNRIRRWNKDEHLQRITDSGLFRYMREMTAHSVESGGVDRLVGLALTFGGTESLIKLGLSESDIGIDTLREATKQILGDRTVPWYLSYRIRIGVT